MHNVIVGVRRGAENSNLLSRVISCLMQFKKSEWRQDLEETLSIANEVKNKDSVKYSGFHSLMQSIYYNEGLYPLADTIFHYVAGERLDFGTLELLVEERRPEKIDWQDLMNEPFLCQIGNTSDFEECHSLLKMYFDKVKKVTAGIKANDQTWRSKWYSPEDKYVAIYDTNYKKYLEDSITMYKLDDSKLTLNEKEVQSITDEEVLRQMWRNLWKSTQYDFCLAFNINSVNFSAWLCGQRSSPASCTAVKLFLLDLLLNH